LKIVVIIPAHNEQKTIAEAIRRIPRPDEIDIEVVVLDDASDDGTADAAEAERVMVLRSPEKLGLARQFRRGLDVALRLGADIVVNMDADLQFDPAEIPRLCVPIARKQADIVLGSRFINNSDQMKTTNRLGNLLLTYIVNKLSGTRLSDTQTGFRAFSRDAAARLNVLSKYTYTQEVIIQASYKRMKIVEVPISSFQREGKSRLIESLPEYAFKAGVTIVLTYLNYWPLRGFSILGLILLLLGLAAGSWSLAYSLTGHVAPYLPSILATLLLTLGSLMFVVALLADMTRGSRELVEELLYREKIRSRE